MINWFLLKARNNFFHTFLHLIISKFFDSLFQTSWNYGLPCAPQQKFYTLVNTNFFVFYSDSLSHSIGSIWIIPSVIKGSQTHLTKYLSLIFWQEPNFLALQKWIFYVSINGSSLTDREMKKYYFQWYLFFHDRNL